MSANWSLAWPRLPATATPPVAGFCPFFSVVFLLASRSRSSFAAIAGTPIRGSWLSSLIDVGFVGIVVCSNRVYHRLATSTRLYRKREPSIMAILSKRYCVEDNRGRVECFGNSFWYTKVRLPRGRRGRLTRPDGHHRQVGHSARAFSPSSWPGLWAGTITLGGSCARGSRCLPTTGCVGACDRSGRYGSACRAYSVNSG